MLRRFMIIVVCICCIITVLGLSNNRWHYEGLSYALEDISASSDVIQDDFSTFALLGYYFSDRFAFQPGEDLIIISPVVIGGSGTNTFQYGIRYDAVIGNDVRSENLYFSSEGARDRAYDLLSFAYDYSINDPTSAEGLFADIIEGVQYIADLLGIFLGILSAIVFVILDVFLLTVIVVKNLLWLLGII